MKELVEFIVKRLAEHPDQVQVSETEQDGALQVHLTVAEEDKGKIIGKQGKVIKAIRSVASAAAGKAGKRSHIDID
jgi:predicted RNA-binding protein YlqC (UPF0109 family)